MTPAAPQWIVKPVDPDVLAEVKKNPEVSHLSPLVHHLLAQRNLTDPRVLTQFLHPRLKDLTDPFLMPEMEAAVDRLLTAIDTQEKITLYGDYDVDGVTSLALLGSVLTAYECDPAYLMPLRMEEGYGISEEGLNRCLTESEPTLIVAVDCGTNSKAELAGLREKGVDTIILDHHEPDPEMRPDCVALVNPKLGDDFHYLCSAGVVFKVAHALLKRRPNPDLDLRNFLDLIALGTVADIVPLVDENRILVHRGLPRVQHTENIGLRALKSECRLNGTINARDIGFRIGPRINAAGRLDTAEASLNLLLERSPEKARDLSKDLEMRNRERQKVEQNMFAEAMALLGEDFNPADCCSIVIGSHGWHPGVVGIVASRIMRQFFRPTFIIAFDESDTGKGSGRSIRGISLVEILAACRDLTVRSGGHDMAAGVTLTWDNYADFRDRFETIVRETSDPDQLRPRIWFDAETRLEDLTFSLLDSYELLEPFGTANPRPLFMTRGVFPVGTPRCLQEKHLRFRLEQDGTVKEAMYFGGAEVDLPAPPWDIAFTIERNEYRGTRSVQISISRVRQAA
ncbi:MAG: single-stranded-DNA-specific exonuclease RecJ [Verrucomicrobiota bacterium]